MKRIRVPLELILIIILLSGCATLQQKLEKATPEEKSRITISQFQSTLKTALDLGSVFVDKNPQYRQAWKDKGLPTASYINTMLDQFISDLDKGKPISFSTIIAAVSTQMGDLIKLLNSWGVKI